MKLRDFHGDEDSSRGLLYRDDVVKMEAAKSSESSVIYRTTTQYRNPKDLDLNSGIVSKTVGEVILGNISK
jgi:hypothetical protein